MPDFLDRVQERELAENEARQRAARLPDVEPPQDRDCCDCGLPIHALRLIAVPTATRCVHCEELRVQRARFMGRPLA